MQRVCELPGCGAGGGELQRRRGLDGAPSFGREDARRCVELGFHAALEGKFEDQLIAPAARALEQPQRQQFSGFQQQHRLELCDWPREATCAGAHAAAGGADPAIFGLAAQRSQAGLEPAPKHLPTAPIIHRRANIPGEQRDADA